MTFDQALLIVQDDEAIQGSLGVVEKVGNRVGMLPEEREVLREMILAGMAYAYLEGSKWRDQLN